MESWQFIQSPAGEWYWVCSNVISRRTRTSEATFPTRTECIANAMASGYQKVAGSVGSAHAKAATARGAGSRTSPGGAQATAQRAQRRNRSKAGRRSKSN